MTLLERQSTVRRALQSGPATGRELASALGLSQASTSRVLSSMGGELLKIGRSSSIQYLLRDASRAQLAATVHRVDAKGQAQPMGQLVPVLGQGFVLVEAGGLCTHSDSLPWWLFDMRPQGYLGRAYCRQHSASLALPANLSEWQDDHVMTALQHHGVDLAGNLLVGDKALLQFANTPVPQPIARADKGARYAELAAAAARGDAAGSSAAGEQPKFSTHAQTAKGAAHVIVKFSETPDSPVSQRWRDLLLAEHLALQLLREHGVAAAASSLIDTPEQRFLELERFDRVGELGRCALFSLAALDAQFVGIGGRWPDVTQALAKAKVVDAEAVQGAALLWAFGHLIGNTDMHAGNLSFLSAAGAQPYQLAPAYDMLPMAFAPRSGGGLPGAQAGDLAAPSIGSQVPAAAWQQALPMAERYVADLQATLESGCFSAGFSVCVAVLTQHVNEARWRIERLAWPV